MSPSGLSNNIAGLVDILVEGRRQLDLPLATAKEHGVHFETGKPVEFHYVRNTEKAPNMGERFGQHIEPHGRYLNHQEPGATYPLPKGWERGKHRFENPLVVEWGTTTGEPHGWKSRISKAFGGKTRKSLTSALLRHGHDGIVTVNGAHTSEIVSLKP